MYCPKCGNKQNDGEKFCSNCGTEFPNSDEYVRTIPTNKEKIQQAVEKGKDTANAVVSKGLEISGDLTKKATEQAKQIGEGIQATLNEHGKGHYIEFLKKHRIVVIGVCACLILFFSLAIFRCGTDEEYYDECYEGADYEGYDEEIDYRQFVNGNSVHITADFLMQGNKVVYSNSNCFEGDPVISGSGTYHQTIRTQYVYVPSDETWIFRNVEAYCFINGIRKNFSLVGIIVNNSFYNKSTTAEYHDLAIHPNDKVGFMLNCPIPVINGERGEFHIIMNATINR